MSSVSAKGEDSRLKILNAASKLFLRGGVAALSVRAISKQAGMSTIGIYNHFDGKQGILDALYIEGFKHVQDAMRGIGERADRSKVLEAVENYLQVAEAHESHYRLIFGEADQGYKPSSEALAARDESFDRLRQVAEAYLPQAAKRGQCLRLALDIWAQIHGYVSIFQHPMKGLESPIDWKASAVDSVGILLDHYR